MCIYHHNQFIVEHRTIKHLSLSEKQQLDLHKLYCDSYMPQKSLSLPKLSQHSSPPPTFKMCDFSRVSFPKVGDTLFYQQSGRKHYNNDSHRLLDIILPREYSLKRLPQYREPSLQYMYPSMNTHKFLLQNSVGKKENSQSKTTLHSKIDDQLDKMKAKIESQKLGTPLGNKLIQVTRPSSKKSEKIPQSPVKSPSNFAVSVAKEVVSPVIIPKKDLSESNEVIKVKNFDLPRSQSDKKDSYESMRMRNPSFLSCSVSYI